MVINMEDDLKELAKIFKALSNEQRLTIFKMIYDLAKKKSCNTSCCDPIERAFTKASECLNISRSTISHHFKELQNAGLITCNRNGKCFDCTVNIELLDRIKEFIS
jgi:ArsR family transcriptional regulator, arsenate/arsenite/antimonite-responsive transcriptional repressor